MRRIDAASRLACPAMVHISDQVRSNELSGVVRITTRLHGAPDATPLRD